MRLRRDSKGRFLPRGHAKRNAPRKKSHAKARQTGRRDWRAKRSANTGEIVTLGRPALVNKKRGHRRAKHNPPELSSIFSKPTLKSVGFAVVGLAGTPIIEGFANRYLPSSIVGNKWAGYAVKGLSAWGLGWGVGKIAGREAGRAVLVGGLAYAGLTIIKDFFPTMFGLVSAPAPATGRYLRSQPLLAEYAFPGLSGPITAGTPSRLDPASRF